MISSWAKHGYAPTAAFIWGALHHPQGHAAHELTTLAMRHRGMTRPGERDDRPTSQYWTPAHPEGRLTISIDSKGALRASLAC